MSRKKKSPDPGYFLYCFSKIPKCPLTDCARYYNRAPWDEISHFCDKWECKNGHCDGYISTGVTYDKKE